MLEPVEGLAPNHQSQFRAMFAGSCHFADPGPGPDSAVEMAPQQCLSLKIALAADSPSFAHSLLQAESGEEEGEPECCYSVGA